jgi:uncharacterized membrane protein
MGMHAGLRHAPVAPGVTIGLAEERRNVPHRVREETVAPLVVLVVSALVFWLAGRAGVAALEDPGLVLRAALATMFFLTASAHWGKRRPDLIRMVPPAFPAPRLLVTVTGLLEILGAIGLLLPWTARAACVCLALLLVALFPANVHAARRHLTIAGQRVPGVPLRSAIQLVFLGALIAAAWLR